MLHIRKISPETNCQRIYDRILHYKTEDWIEFWSPERIYTRLVSPESDKIPRFLKLVILTATYGYNLVIITLHIPNKMFLFDDKLKFRRIVRNFILHIIFYFICWIFPRAVSILKIYDIIAVNNFKERKILNKYIAMIHAFHSAEN